MENNYHYNGDETGLLITMIPLMNPRECQSLVSLRINTPRERKGEELRQELLQKRDMRIRTEQTERQLYPDRIPDRSMEKIKSMAPDSTELEKAHRMTTHQRDKATDSKSWKDMILRKSKLVDTIVIFGAAYCYVFQDCRINFCVQQC